MFILAYRTDYNTLKVVTNYFTMPKEFTCESEVIDYCQEKDIDIFQAIEVTI